MFVFFKDSAPINTVKICSSLPKIDAKFSTNNIKTLACNENVFRDYEAEIHHLKQSCFSFCTMQSIIESPLTINLNIPSLFILLYSLYLLNIITHIHRTNVYVSPCCPSNLTLVETLPRKFYRNDLFPLLLLDLSRPLDPLSICLCDGVSS